MWTCPKLTKESYIRFIKEPKLLLNPVRDVILFENPILEILTMSDWYVLPLLYIPTIIVFLYHASYYLDWLSIIACFIAGMIIWTPTEYIIHRFFFHAEDESFLLGHKAFLIAHFLAHGIHHAYPQDRYRLVFPAFPGSILLFCYELPLFKFLFP